MEFLHFSDRMIAYETFLNDIAAHVVKMIKTDKDDPEFISQRRAYALFGRSNVERWRKLGRITPYKRPGKLDYKTAELRLLQRIEQDYLNR